jgi:hypothetical protein
MKKLRLFLAVLVGVSASTALTHAQGPGWLSDRSRAQGPGFRLGNLELHPGVGVEAGYDSNVFYEDTDGPREPQGSALFRISPHVYISTLTQQREQEGEARGEGATQRMFDLKAGVSGEVYFFLADAARHNVAVNGDFDLTINPTGRFGARIYNHFARTIRPFTGRSGDDRRLSYGQNSNVAGLTLTGRSRGGIIQANLGYSFRLSVFDQQDFRYANQFGHQISADTHFRFLPNTSVFWDATLDFADYYNDGTADPLTLANNWRLRTRVGLNGVITPKLSATVALGYTSMFVKDPRFDDFDSVLALAGLKVRLSPTTNLGFGYEREAQGSIVGLYRIQDRGYLDFQWLLGRSFLLALNTWVAYMQFGTIVNNDGTVLGDRDDVFVSVKLFGEYRFTDWLALNATVGYFGDFTDFEYQIEDAAGGPVPDPAGFNKIEAWLGLRVFY